MTWRLIEIDDELLDRARTILGTHSVSATVERALELAGAADQGRDYVGALASLPELEPTPRTAAWDTGQR